MDLEISGFNGIVIFGALQGLVLSIILFLKRNHPGSKYLAGFFLVLVYNSIETLSWSLGSGGYLVIDLLTYVLVFTLGPFLYLYNLSLFDQDGNASQRKTFLHFMLPAFQLIIQLGVYGYHNLLQNKLIESSVTSRSLYALYLSYSEPLSFIVFISYLLTSFLVVKSFSASDIGRNRSHAVRIRWGYFLLITLSILSAFWLITILLGLFFNYEQSQNYYWIEIVIVFFVQWTAIIGYHKVHVIGKLTVSRVAKDKAGFKQYVALLHKAMETEKMYLDPQLNQAKLSLYTGISVKVMSAALNNFTEGNFNDFVNGYRVEEVKTKLQDKKYDHLTIGAIALESGFNSHATFQRAFKNKIGVSPKDYLVTLGKNKQK